MNNNSLPQSLRTIQDQKLGLARLGSALEDLRGAPIVDEIAIKRAAHRLGRLSDSVREVEESLLMAIAEGGR